MRFSSKQTHTADILLPVSLYFVFAVSALAVLLLAANIYRQTTENSSMNYTAQTTLAYLTEKVHQNDTKNAVTIGTFDNHEALILRQTCNAVDYVTYIYVHEGNLMELFTKSGTSLSAEDGHSILPLETLSMCFYDSNTLFFSCTDTENHSLSCYVKVHSDSSTF